MKHERKLILANFDKAQGCIEIGLIINFFSVQNRGFSHQPAYRDY